MKETSEKSCWAFLFLALLAGAVLRLSFPGDIEYKVDEKYMLEAVRSIETTGSWPPLGMESGVMVKNPGMSIWIFGALTLITHASTPPELARAVQWLNILALVVLAFFSLHLLPREERGPWIWATAFAAVNPLAVLFQRKIWAQSTLPFFCVLFWMAWHYRDKRTGAFFWGLLGIFLGQIHMSGFFLTAGVFLWTTLRERRIQWVAWLGGSLAGAIPLVPWLQYMWTRSGTGFSWKSLLWILVPRYWADWLTDAWGIGLSHSLAKVHFMDFLGYPLLGGDGTYLVAASHIAIVGAGILLFLSAKKAGGFLQWIWIKDSSETGLAVNSVLAVSGILMTLSCLFIRRHYLIMSFPLEWVWLSRLGLRDPRQGQRYLAVIWVAQLLISACFLGYIHVNHGDPLGDYGPTYESQIQPK